MTRPHRIELAGGIHHVMSRGIARQPIYLDDDDRRAFLRHLEDSVVRFRWTCVAYCLMGNHFHLLVRTPRPNLGAGMRDLNSSYVQDFNRRRGRDGSLLKARFRSQLVQDSAYLLAAARYIALNPVRGGLVDRARDWPWGSFAALDSGEASSLADHRPLFEAIDSDPATARLDFVALVEGGEDDLPAYKPTAAIFGDREFVARNAPAQRPEPPVARTAWDEARPPLDEVMTAARDEAIARARLVHRYTIKEIAAALGCSTETVRRRLAVWYVRT